MQRTVTILTLILMVALAPVLRASARGSEPAVIVVLLDTSGSTGNSFDEYRKAWSRIIEQTRGGDRVIVAVVQGRALGKEASVLRHVEEITLPTYSILRDNPLTHEDAINAARNRLTAHFAKVLTLPKGESTELLRSIRDAGRLFRASSQPRRVLILLSDLLEDSEFVFATTRLTDRFTEQVIARLKSEKRLPELRGVDVYAVTPGTTAPAKQDEVERFFTHLFDSTGASMRPEHMGTLVTYRQ